MSFADTLLPEFDQEMATTRKAIARVPSDKGTFKPHPKAYRLGVDVLRLEKQEILFVAFAGWDAAGARWFGYPTYWNNRLGAAAEELGTAPDASGATLDALARWLGTADPGS